MANRSLTFASETRMHQNLARLASTFFVMLVLSTVGCSGQTEEQALVQLRELTREGKLPPESVVASIESRFAGKRTGALAKLLHARIKFESADYAGAAAMLDTDIFRKKTKVADHALWYRGLALHWSQNHAAAMKVLSDLVHDFPDSVRVRDAKLVWAASANESGHAAEVPAFLADLNDKNDAEALVLTAKAYEKAGAQPDAIRFFRRVYFFAPGTAQAKESEDKLTALAQPLTPQSAEEQTARADKLLAAKRFSDAATAYNDLAARFASAVTTNVQLKRITALANAGKMPDAQAAFNSLPPTD